MTVLAPGEINHSSRKILTNLSRVNLTNHKIKGPDMSFRRPDARSNGSFTGPQSIGLETLSSEGFPFETEDGRIIEDPVKRTQQSVFFLEVLSPERRLSVAREDDVVCAFLVVGHFTCS